MIATGTDVKPLECLIFMRTVKSRTYFEQMIGRGVRVMDDTEFQSVTDDSKHKDRFIVVDAVGVTDTDLIETTLPLERKPGQPEGPHESWSASATRTRTSHRPSLGVWHASTRASPTTSGRCSRSSRGGRPGDIAHGIVEALDPDNQVAAVEAAGGSADDPAAVEQAAAA